MLPEMSAPTPHQTDVHDRDTTAPGPPSPPFRDQPVVGRAGGKESRRRSQRGPTRVPVATSDATAAGRDRTGGPRAWGGD
jgi:hypothetical protein